MIISRKRFEAEIEKAVEKKQEEFLKQRRYEEEAQNVWRTIHALEDRVYKLEEKADRNHWSTVDAVPAWKV